MKNKEIEELLNELSKSKEIYYDNYDYIKLNCKEQQLLSSYIEQLEECYCNRTDCIGRIKNSKKYDSLLQKYKQLENNRDKAIEFINSEEFNTLTINKRKKLNDILKGDSDE